MPERKPIDRWLMVTAEHLQVGASTNPRRVAMRFHFPGDMIGLAEGIGLAVALQPSEARRIARLLEEQADFVEGPKS